MISFRHANSDELFQDIKQRLLDGDSNWDILQYVKRHHLPYLEWAKKILLNTPERVEAFNEQSKNILETKDKAKVRLERLIENGWYSSALELAQTYGFDNVDRMILDHKKSLLKDLVKKGKDSEAYELAKTLEINPDVVKWFISAKKNTINKKYNEGLSNKPKPHAPATPEEIDQYIDHHLNRDKPVETTRRTHPTNPPTADNSYAFDYWLYSNLYSNQYTDEAILNVVSIHRPDKVEETKVILSNKDKFFKSVLEKMHGPEKPTPEPKPSRRDRYYDDNKLDPRFIDKNKWELNREKKEFDEIMKQIE